MLRSQEKCQEQFQLTKNNFTRIEFNLCDALSMHEVLFIEEKRPSLITQADSIRTKALVVCFLSSLQMRIQMNHFNYLVSWHFMRIDF